MAESRSRGVTVDDGRTTSRPEPGARIGDYELIAELGRGGMGVVYEARQVSLDRRVALKLLHANVTAFDRDLVRFQREAQAGARLSHPGIVAVYAVGREAGCDFIAQELVPGGRTLADELERLRRLTRFTEEDYRRQAELMAEIAEAVAQAHDAGVVHRDIKPSNVLLDQAGRPKLGDFGLALLDEDPGLTLSWEITGTPSYLAPERIANLPGADGPQGDVFALGVTMYEAFTLHRAFEGDTRDEVIGKILRHDPPDPRRLRARLPRDLSVICTKAMEKRSAQRYGSAAEVAADLRRFLNHEPILARPPSPWSRAQKWGRRHPVVSVAGAVGALSLLIVTLLLIETIDARVDAEDARDEALDARIDAEEARDDARLEAQSANRVADALSHLFESVDPALSRGKDVTARALLEDNVAAVRADLAGEPLVLARIAVVMSRAFKGLGLFERAEHLAAEAVALHEQHAGPLHLRTIESLDMLASAHRAAGRYELAEEKAREVVNRLESTGLDIPRDLFRYRANLADCIAASGRLEEAEQVFDEVLREARDRLGADDASVVEIEADLGVLYFDQGRFADAAPLFERQVDLGLRAVGPDHPTVISRRFELATLYNEQGRYDEALAVLEVTRESAQRVYDDGHPLKSAIENATANVELHFGKIVESEASFRKVLADVHEALGPDHPVAISTRSNLANCLTYQGRNDEAVELLEEAHAAAQRSLGVEHPKTLRIYGSLGTIAVNTHRVEDAERIFLELRPLHERALGPDHPDTARTLSGLSTVYWYTRRASEALPLVEHVVRVRREAFGEHHHDTLIAREKLALVRRDLGDHDGAEREFLALLEFDPQVLDRREPLSIRFRRGLATVYMVAARYDEADAMIEEALALATGVPPLTNDLGRLRAMVAERRARGDD